LTLSITLALLSSILIGFHEIRNRLILLHYSTSQFLICLL
jgi:hypothetical protein